MTRLAERTFVWAGGALFVGSLAFLLRTYAIAFDPRRSGFDWRALLVDAGLVTAFALHHSLFARDWAKRAVARVVPDRLLRSVYVWVASVLLLVVCLLWKPVGGEIYHGTGPLLWLLRVVQPIGFALIASSVTAISPLELAGIRTPTVRDTLQERGPYRIVRHPLYLGWVLCVFGDTHMTVDRLTFAVLTTFYLFLAIPWEEEALEDAFHTSYARYKAKVRWRVIPYVY